VTDLVRLYVHPEADYLDDRYAGCIIEVIPALPNDAPRPCLWASPTHLELHVADRRLSGVWVSVTDLTRRARQGSDLTRACGRLVDMTVLDPMAGWGIDGVLLAAAGARVVMIEREPLLALLLHDLLRRLKSSAGVSDGGRARILIEDDVIGQSLIGDNVMASSSTEGSLVERSATAGSRAVQVHCADGYGVLTGASSRHACAAVSGLQDARDYDIVYLDPMFPERDKHALPNKRMQAVASLFDDDQARPSVGLGAWVTSARERARRRVVLKRRLRDPVEFAPDWQIRGRSVRYDVWRGLASALS